MIPTMNRENRLLVTDDPVEIEKQPVEVQDFRKSIRCFKRIHRLYLKLITKTPRKMSTCNQLDLETLLGSRAIMSKNHPKHCMIPTMCVSSVRIIS